MNNTKRTQIFSYGGGVQTVAMTALVLQGKLPRPDYIVFADTSREKQSTWDYMEEIVQPALENVGLNINIAGHEHATVDLYANNGDLLLPAYTSTGKLPTFCSNEWKKRVVQRWLRNHDVEQCDVWIGFSVDEQIRRAKASGDRGWYRRVFPLYDLGLSRADCRIIIENHGWPPPPSSACWMCPNMDDSEWFLMRRDYPSDFKKAALLQEEIQEWDGDVWLTSHRKPLEAIEFDPHGESRQPSRHQCSFACMT